MLDGRDIGTVICPEAEAKLFVTASEPARAARRFAELTARGVDTTLEAVLEDMLARDARDRERATAPLTPAADAVLLDTSALDADAAIAAALKIVTDCQEAQR